MGELEKIKRYRRYAPGAEIAAAGEPLDFVGTVVEGHVGLRRTLADGRRQIVGLLFPSDFLGRPKRTSVPYDAEAVGEVVLCTFERPRFERLLAEVPAVEERLLNMVLDDLDAARETLLMLGRKSAREKVASFLLMVARRSAAQRSAEAASEVAPGAGQAIVFDLPLGREDMAEFLGLTIETVSRQMTALRKAGVLSLDSTRRVRLLDWDALVETAGDDSDGGLLG